MQQPSPSPEPSAPGPLRAMPAKLRHGLLQYARSIWPDHDAQALADRFFDAFWSGHAGPARRARPQGRAIWSERDNYVITYGNSIVDGQHKPLDLLWDFSRRYLGDAISGIHILPYFPFTSDDGFAVTDYLEVNYQLGEWADIERIAGDFKLMSDLVLNHCSSQSKWFNDYLQGHEPYDRFFFEASPEDDLGMVVRPRAHDLLREVQTANGPRHVWCTFSHDQVDFDFSNPEVLCAFLRVLRAHIDHGVRTVRLDAVAFVWKEVGTSCIHLRQTHEIVRLIRLLTDYNEDPITLITETNVPNAENLSYFGNLNEAHVVYNFPLPPLILHALLFGTAKYLKKWQMAMPPAQAGCSYLNFTASHDGIGMRPAEGLIPDAEIAELICVVEGFGGLVSLRTMPDGSRKPYELNVTLFDALKGTRAGEDALNIPRFLCSQAIAMALEGIPAFYIHSLFATGNDCAGVESQGYNRAINRYRWDYGELQAALDDPHSRHAIVFAEMLRMIRIRSDQPAFAPNATQFTLQLGDGIFGFWRQSPDRSQSIFALANVTDAPITLNSVSLNLIEGEPWTDLLSGEAIDPLEGAFTLAPYQSRWISNRRGRG